MSELSRTERAGCAKLLQLMSKSDLVALSDTVTNKMIVVEGTTDAVQSILSFTKNAEELLKRRRVQRDLIFKYLVQEGESVLPTYDKHQLITICLERWSPQTVTKRKMPQHIYMEEKSEMNRRQESLPSTSGVGFDPLAFGKQFCLWFFQLLNSHNPVLRQPPQDWGPQHFWCDVKMQLINRVGSENNVEEYSGADLVSHRLLAMTKDELLYLSPNLDTPGLIATVSPHGLVLIAVAGTIHRDQVCLGIFEQIFGLIRSPLENNSWKMKFVKLQVRGQDSCTGTNSQPPALSCSLSELQRMCNQ